MLQKIRTLLNWSSNWRFYLFFSLSSLLFWRFPLFFFQFFDFFLVLGTNDQTSSTNKKRKLNCQNKFVDCCLLFVVEREKEEKFTTKHRRQNKKEPFNFFDWKKHGIFPSKIVFHHHFFFFFASFDPFLSLCVFCVPLLLVLVSLFFLLLFSNILLLPGKVSRKDQKWKEAFKGKKIQKILE